MVFAVVVLTFAPRAASAARKHVPVFVIGIDDGLSPAIHQSETPLAIPRW